jgi:predicted transposase/invertase (TIGR01784 family)
MDRKAHDSAYKYLFSNKKIFHQLITRFVDLDFAKKITLDSIQPVDKSFIADDLTKRESDLIYQVNLNGQKLFIYILVEFQSTVDKTIPIRMLLYILHLYDLTYRNSTEGKLPAIFPILLYNGDENWTIPYQIEDLISHQIPKQFIPHFTYYPIIENKILPAKLDKLQGFVSAVFYLEQQNEPEKLAKAIEHVISFLEEEQPEELRMFTSWVNEVFRGALDPESIAKIKELTEVKPMLAQVVDKMRIESKEEGKIEDARKMFEEGLDLLMIARITGLSEELLDKIKKGKA